MLPGWGNGAGTPFDLREANGIGRQPYATQSAVADSNGVAIGCFAWLDASGVAHNVLTSLSLLGLVLPVVTWQPYFRLFLDQINGFPVTRIRAGTPCMLASIGDYIVRFPNGGEAGSQVYADPATGLPSSDDGGGAFIATPWTLMQSGGCGSALRISSFIQPF